MSSSSFAKLALPIAVLFAELDRFLSSRRASSAERGSSTALEDVRPMTRALTATSRSAPLAPLGEARSSPSIVEGE